MNPLKPFALEAWIESHRQDLRPPVGNRRLFREGDFIIMAVGGPNARRDYHRDPGEEFFYQLEGGMVLRTIQDGARVDVPIGAGEVLLIPPWLPHSPQRYADSVGLVIERTRRPGELDVVEWYCEHCGAMLHADSFVLTDVEVQFKAAIERFEASEALRTCGTCGTVMAPQA